MKLNTVKFFDTEGTEETRRAQSRSNMLFSVASVPPRWPL